MTIHDYPMAGPVDISSSQFDYLLERGNSPAWDESDLMYDACLENGVSLVTFLAFFNHESKYGTLGICHDYDTKNPGNVRSPEDPSLGTIIQTRGGPFAKYPSWENGALDWGKRIIGPKYAGSGLLTVRQVLPKYAPTGDNNDPEAYIRSVLSYIEANGDPDVVAAQAISEEGSVPTISISNLIDISRDIATAGPGEGGVHRGPYAASDVKRGAVVHYDGAAEIDWAWVAENPVGFYNTRANYHVHKNWGTDNSPVYGSGIMYHIGLGPNGEAYQLRPLNAKLWHCGDPTLNDEALAIFVPVGGDQAPNDAMIERLTTILEEYRHQTGDEREAVVGHGEVTSTTCPGPFILDYLDRYRAGTDVYAASATINGFLVGGGFYQYYVAQPDPVLALGLPLTEEGPLACEDGVVRTCQVFERMLLEHHPDGSPGWTVVGRRLGAEFLASASADGAKARATTKVTTKKRAAREAVVD